MTELTEQKRRMMVRLEAAKRGDEDARREVALYVFTEYKGRLSRFYRAGGVTQDPAVSQDDLEKTFFEGIFRAVGVVDGRGDPLYHLGQRGVWSVMSELRVVEERMKHRLRPRGGRGWNWGDEDATDPIERVADPTGDFGDAIIERHAAEGRVRVLLAGELKAREQQAVDVILSGAAGDPDDLGFNKRLAEEMGISPQRASQVMQDLKKKAMAA